MPWRTGCPSSQFPGFLQQGARPEEDPELREQQWVGNYTVEKVIACPLIGNLIFSPIVRRLALFL
jgi:hypothetical protein